MAIIKKSELRGMQEAALQQKLAELRKEHMKLKAQLAVKKSLENPGRMRAVRRTIAQVLTALRQRQLAGGGLRTMIPTTNRR